MLYEINSRVFPYLICDYLIINFVILCTQWSVWLYCLHHSGEVSRHQNMCLYWTMEISELIYQLKVWLTTTKVGKKKCASGKGIAAKCLLSRTSQKSSIKSSTPGSRGVANIVSVTMPLLSIKDLAVSHNVPVEYKRPVQAVCKRESGALNWAFLGGAREQTFGSNALPTGTLFFSNFCRC